MMVVEDLGKVEMTDSGCCEEGENREILKGTWNFPFLRPVTFFFYNLKYLGAYIFAISSSTCLPRWKFIRKILGILKYS